EGAYESLAGLLVSHSPDGVGVEPVFRSVHRMSPLFPTGITPRGDRFQSNPRPRNLRLRIYMLSSPLLVGGPLPDERGKRPLSSVGFSGSARNEPYRDPVKSTPGSGSTGTVRADASGI